MVMVLDVPSDWGLMARNMSLHNHHACPNPSYNEPFFRV